MDVREAWEAHEGKGLMKLSTFPGPQHRHFERFQDRPVTVLEIGVQSGGSLQMWRSYFGERSRIVGVDIDPACKAHEGERIAVRIGDQTDRAFLADLAAEWGPFDVVMDDGGHTMEQQIVSFEALWPHVTVGGVYVCEDSFTSWLPDYGGGRGRPDTFMEAVAKPLVDEMHAWFSRDAPSDLTRSVTSLHFYCGFGTCQGLIAGFFRVSSGRLVC